MLGMYANFTPKFVKKYANLREPMIEAFNTFHGEVRSNVFPSEEFCYNTKVEGLE